jgi:hypothetical protein
VALLAPDLHRIGRPSGPPAPERTCEIALHEVTGRPYESFVLALERLSR